MAEFEIDTESMSGLMKSLQGLDLFDDSTQAKLLNAGSDQLMEAIRQEADRSSFNLKRITAKLSRSKKLKKDKNGVRYVEVTVSGKNERGERNATVAFVLNYGRSKKFGEIHGSYFWTRAARRTNKTIMDTYEKVITTELHERKLI